MTNNVMLIGRLVSNPSGDKITIAIPRSYKNAEGIYETDFIDIKLGNNIAKNVMEYCKKGDLIDIRGSLQSTMEDDGDGHFIKRGMIVVADKVTFLSTNPRNDNA